MSEETVYQKIARVTGELAKTGVSKDKTAPAKIGGYAFRGIDDVYNALAPKLAKAGLVISPDVLKRKQDIYPGRDNKRIFHVQLKVRYRFISADDGSETFVTVWGEAMDTGDKATNKAMSAAYKYACFQVFCIPLEGQDLEADDMEIANVNESVVSEFVGRIDACFTETIRAGRKGAHCEDEAALSGILSEINAVDDESATKLAVWRQLESPVRSYISDMEKG